MKGTIKRFYFKKGFGFIENEAGEELFFHYSDFDGPKRLLRSDTEVTFTESEGEKGLCAIELQIEGYDPASDPDHGQERPAQNRSHPPKRNPPASAKPAATPSTGGSLITGLIVGLIIGAGIGYYVALN
jgi:CspA family cold shock protein